MDCELLAGATVCKETLSGGPKTCQASTACTQTCSSGEFCDASSTCQDGIRKKNLIHVLIY